MQHLAATIDHTALKATTTEHAVRALCHEALTHGFASVCINPCFVPLAAQLLAGSAVKVCTVVGFPLGANQPATKAFETALAVREGAQEIDMVINVGAVKDGNWQLVEDDIKAVLHAAKHDAASKALVKVIIETCYLDEEEKRRVCAMAAQLGADFVKTSTGFGTGGATAADVALMREAAPTLGVKASGGISDAETACAMLAAGATRLGASAGLHIIGA